MNAPQVSLKSLDTLWFQVGGTVCNLACTHCFISCSPTNHTHEFMTLAEVRRYLADPSHERAERANLIRTLCYRDDGQAGARVAEAMARIGVHHRTRR